MFWAVVLYIEDSGAMFWAVVLYIENSGAMFWAAVLYIEDSGRHAQVWHRMSSWILRRWKPLFG